MGTTNFFHTRTTETFFFSGSTFRHLGTKSFSFPLTISFYSRFSMLAKNARLIEFSSNTPGVTYVLIGNGDQNADLVIEYGIFPG